MKLEDTRLEKRNKKLRVILSVAGSLLGLVLLGLVGFYKLVLYNAPEIKMETLPLDKKLLISIPKGSSLFEIARILEESGVIESAKLFSIAARYQKSERNLKAGQYLLPAHCSNYQLLQILQNAVPQSVRITIPEGKNLQAIYQLLATKLPIDSIRWEIAVRDTSLCREFEIRAKSVQGYLTPNTYFIDPGTNEREIVKLMLLQFDQIMDDNLRKKAESMQMSLHEVVTLASIIEGETADAEERYMVSAVYHNRLIRKMLLQADPTVQYIIPDGPRRLYNKDLEIDSPYNTYKYSGLPPGPVNNPGKASILAALYPAKSDYLYMVADGKGKHIFSKTMAEHLKARKKLDDLRKELLKKKK